MIVYNKALNNFKEISHAISVQMLVYYNGIGKFSMVLPIDDYNLSAIENDGVLYDAEKDLSFTIQNHKSSTVDNTISVNGYSCNWLLNRRVLASKATINNVEQDVYSAVKSNLRGLYKVSCGNPKGFTETADSVFCGGQVLEKLMPTLEESKIGQRMKWDPDTMSHVFELYKGEDKTTGIHAVIFSEEFGTASDVSVTKDSSVFSSVIYVQGLLKDDTEIYEAVGTAEGIDRSEYWLRETLRQEDEETEEQLRERMRQRGYEEITSRIARTTFGCTIDSSEFGPVYKLGDIVSCVSLRFGLEMTARISGVKYTMDRNDEKVELILGEPVLTALDEVKLRNA